MENDNVINLDMVTIYDLDLHDEAQISDVEYVKRVPGGWLYIDTNLCTSTFVPFNNEFMKSSY